MPHGSTVANVWIEDSNSPMTHRERIETAWSFQEADRVPIELQMRDGARKEPLAARLVELVDAHADNVHFAHWYDWGFLGWPSTRSERVIEHQVGEYIRKERIQSTTAGKLVAVTRHPDSDDAAPDFHWERRFVTTPGDLEQLLSVPLTVPPIDIAAYERVVREVGDGGLVLTELLHPLGRLVRNSTMEEVYTWFITHRDLMHRFLAVTSEYVAQAVEAMIRAGARPYFHVCAHEMLIPPWAGMAFFEEFVFPYDKRVNAVARRRGGKVRAHCHGNCMDYLKRFWEMGIDAVEPLEAPPMGNVDLAEAKRRVGDRMMLSGNIPSPYFPMWSPEQVRDAVREAIRVAAPGGGFSLRTTGGTAGTNAFRDREQLRRIVKNCEAYIEAGLEYGTYPIQI